MRSREHGFESPTHLLVSVDGSIVPSGPKTLRYTNCLVSVDPGRIIVPKRSIRIPLRKTDRRVRWTFEVSADVDGKPARTSRSSKATKQSRTSRRSTKETSTSNKTRAKTLASERVITAAPPAVKGSGRPVATDEQPRTLGMSYSRVIALAAVATLVVAVLAVPRRSAVGPALVDNSKSDAPDSSAHAIAAKPAGTPPAAAPLATSIAKPDAATHASQSVKTASTGATQSSAAAPSTALSPVVELHGAAPSDARRSASTPAVAIAPESAAPASGTNALTQVTITGCLEPGANSGRFRLTDTEGANAPKSRSWRSGFLKKHSAAVDLVGVPDVSALRQQVGQRVAVTGVQTDRELKVHSVRVISTSCK